jgi:nucleoside-diphosphate-sugar epimerase
MIRLGDLRLTRGVLLRIGADVIMVQLALIGGLMLRFLWAVMFQSKALEHNQIMFLGYVSGYMASAWPLALISLAVFLLSGIYSRGRTYRVQYKLLMILEAVTLSYLLYASVVYFFNGGLRFPRGALLAAWILTVTAMMASRVWSQVWIYLARAEHEETSKDTDDARWEEPGQRRILIIGGAGYIGSALIPELLESGYQVRLFDRLLYGTEPIRELMEHPRLEVIQGDFRHVDEVVQAMRGVDSVVHLGAIVGDPACDLDEQLTIEVNLVATRMIAQVAKGVGVRHFVFASTCSVYGACRDFLDERSLVRPVSLYGRTKLAAERLLLEMANDQFQPTIARFATIYGLSGRSRFDLVVNLLAAKAKTEGQITIFGGDQWRPFVHVKDAARAVAILLDAPLSIVGSQTYNVGSDEQNYQIHQIGELVQQHVPSATISTNDNIPDRRDYRVRFHKIASTFGFKPQWTVPAGIEQVIEAIADGTITDYRDAQYSNVKFLSEQGTERMVPSDNDWMRRLNDDSPIPDHPTTPEHDHSSNKTPLGEAASTPHAPMESTPES